MGVELEHHAFVRGSYRPSAERVARFLRALSSEGFIASPERWKKKNGVATWSIPDAAKRTGASLRVGYREEPAPIEPSAAWLRSKKPLVVLSFPVREVFERGFRYPLTVAPFVRDGVYFDLELRWSRHYLSLVSSDASVPSFSGKCVCGEPLAVDQGFPRRYRVRCPRCGEDPAKLGSGGTLHRFALTVACGKCVPETSRAPLRLVPELRALVERSFHAPFTELSTIS